MFERHLPWHYHELLEGETTTCMRTTVEHILEWHWEDIWLLGACEVGDVSIERHTLVRISSIADCLSSDLRTFSAAAALATAMVTVSDS
jgi:hypothetical protein